MGARSSVALAALLIIAPAQDGPITLTPRDAEPGQVVQVAVDGFAPGSEVDVFLDLVHRVAAMADGTGAVDVALELPGDLVPGRHWVTALERGSGRAMQARLRVEAQITDWPQAGADAGRTGAATIATFTSMTFGDLRERWVRDLEVLDPGEEIFVTDAAGEVATPAVVDGERVVSTWFASDVLQDGSTVRRVAITATDLTTGEVTWRRVADSESFSALSFGTPVLAGGTLVARWEGDRVLLGLDPATGAVRWQLPAGEPGRFGDLLVVDGHVVVPLDRPGGERDALLALDPSDATRVWKAPLSNGSEWRLAADDGVVVAASGRRWVVGVHVADGTVGWQRAMPLSWWGGVVAADGLLLVPTSDAVVSALRIDDGETAWTWSPWSRGECGSACVDPLVTPRAASEGVAIVAAQAETCPANVPEEDCEFAPWYRTRVTAIDLATGEVWTHDDTRGHAAGSVVIAGEVAFVQSEQIIALGVGDGTTLGTIPPPERPHTYGAQHSWAGQPIATGSSLVIGGADGAVTVLSVETVAARPDPAALVPNPTLSPSMTTPAPATEPETAPWAEWAWLAIGATALAAIATAALVLRRGPSRRKRTT